MMLSSMKIPLRVSIFPVMNDFEIRHKVKWFVEFFTCMITELSNEWNEMVFAQIFIPFHTRALEFAICEELVPNVNMAIGHFYLLAIIFEENSLHHLLLS